MYIDAIELENVRTFAANKTIEFVHPDREYGESSDGATPLPKPKLDNVNLLFGDNVFNRRPDSRKNSTDNDKYCSKYKQMKSFLQI